MLKIELGNAWAANSVNTAIFRQSGILTCDNFQLAAFYNNQSKLMIVKRDLASGITSIGDLPGSYDLSDAHNSVSIGVDPDKFIHISYCQHASPLRYRRSTLPACIVDWTEEVSMTGKHEGSVTYPGFLQATGDGPLLFFYRDGLATKGSLRIKEWLPLEQRWEDRTSPILSGADQRPWASCPYWNHPAVAEDGSIHLTFVWRTTWLGPEKRLNNINIDYARSADFGRNWSTSLGRPFKLPITQVNSETVWPISPGSNLINQAGMALDSVGHPHIVFYSDDSQGVPQYQHVYFNGVAWNGSYISWRENPFVLKGGGTLQIPISRPDIVIDRTDHVYVIYRADFTNNYMVAQRLIPPDYKPDPRDVRILSPHPLGFAEPVIDRYRWKRDCILSLLLQKNYQPDHDAGDIEPIYESISIVEWDLAHLWANETSPMKRRN
jgi:hypothetical protein